MVGALLRRPDRVENKSRVYTVHRHTVSNMIWHLELWIDPCLNKTGHSRIYALSGSLPGCHTFFWKGFLKVCSHQMVLSWGHALNSNFDHPDLAGRMFPSKVTALLHVIKDLPYIKMLQFPSSSEYSSWWTNFPWLTLIRLHPIFLEDAMEARPLEVPYECGCFEGRIDGIVDYLWTL
jgi:hypothetical protein